MWPFSKKWSPPVPQLTMLVSLANQELPTLLMLANPAGIDGAVTGMAGPSDAKPTEENMTTPMQAGQFAAISPAGGACGIQVERVETQSKGLSMEPAMLEIAGLTEEMLAKFNQPTWRVIIGMEAPGEQVRDSVIFATRLAQRLAALGDGIVMDTSAYRFFGPTGWAVKDPDPEFDVREHVHIHIESDSRWFHAHGLIKFGRPELEIYDVPPELEEIAYATLLDIAQYVINSALIEPGQTCGDPNQPFYAREATRNPEHWNKVPVLELVDIDEHGKPVSSGAPKALQFSAASDAGSDVT
jgi:hypothetical protein